MLQTNNTGVCSQCLGHTGFAPAHGVCAFPVNTAWALGCSAGNCLRLALGCMHFPGLHSGSGVWVLLEAQTLLSLRFVPFPSPNNSGDQVFGKHSHCDLSLPLSVPLGFLVVQLAHLLRWMLTVQNPEKS